MEKFSKKHKHSTKPNFDKEINLFLSKIDFEVDKHLLKNVMNCLFETIESFDVDMWQLKTRLKENLNKVDISKFESEISEGDWAGRFFPITNEIEIKKPEKTRDERLVHYIVHEVLHNLSSLRIDLATKAPYGTKQQEIVGITGFNGEHLGTDGNHTISFSYFDLAMLTEGITELLAQKTTKNYFGESTEYIYPLPKKIACQLLSIGGNDIIKAYFENDLTVLQDLFSYEISKDKKENDKFLKIIDNKKPVGLEEISFFKYIKTLEAAFLYYEQPVTKENADLSSSIFYLLTMQHLALFQVQLIKDFYKNADSFLSGNEVKQTLLKSFVLYAKNIRNFVTADSLYEDLWYDYTDIIDETYDIVSSIFNKTKNFTMPLISDRDMKKHIYDAQKICKYNLWGHYDIEKIDITKVRKINLDHELQRHYQKSEKNYKWKKFKPQTEFDMNYIYDQE